jgi:hypothetical protein
MDFEKLGDGAIFAPKMAILLKKRHGWGLLKFTFVTEI